MSFQVLVIPEDPTNNGYILKPLVERMLAEAGKPNARVLVLPNPRVQGLAHAVKSIRTELPDRYAHFDLWLFLPDADCASGLNELEAEMSNKGVHLICCAARPEVEAWLLAGHKDRLAVPWSAIADHHRLKEEIFEPFLKTHGDARAVGRGREKLMRETLSNYRGLLTLCPELDALEVRLREAISS